MRKWRSAHVKLIIWFTRDKTMLVEDQATTVASLARKTNLKLVVSTPGLISHELSVTQQLAESPPQPFVIGSGGSLHFWLKK
jgi:hypothetical protein